MSLLGVDTLYLSTYFEVNPFLYIVQGQLGCPVYKDKQTEVIVLPLVEPKVFSAGALGTDTLIINHTS